jgi:hypothetical protein
MSSQPVRRRRRRQRCELFAAQLLLSLRTSAEAAKENKMHSPKRQLNPRKRLPQLLQHNSGITDIRESAPTRRVGIFTHHPALCSRLRGPVD